MTWCDESKRNEVNELMRQRRQGEAETVRFGWMSNTVAELYLNKSILLGRFTIVKSVKLLLGFY